MGGRDRNDEEVMALLHGAVTAPRKHPPVFAWYVTGASGRRGEMRRGRRGNGLARQGLPNGAFGGQRRAPAPPAGRALQFSAAAAA